MIKERGVKTSAGDKAEGRRVTRGEKKGDQMKIVVEKTCQLKGKATKKVQEEID